MSGLSTVQFEVHDQEFKRVVGDAPSLMRVASVDAHEGPVYAADEDALYFTTTPVRNESSSVPEPVVATKRLD